MPKRTQFYSERVYSVQAAPIPARLRKSSRESVRWSIAQVIAELVRQLGQCSHVADPKPPVSVYGYLPDQLQVYAEALEQLSAKQVETYTRRGKEHTRLMKKTTPTLLSAIASYPEPDRKDTDARRRWIDLVVEASKSRWGKRLRSIIAHDDEAFYHLHILVDNVGATVKPLHMGYAAAEAEPVQVKKGEAYRRGCSTALDWYHGHVAGPMGWSRVGPAPRPRIGRARAMSMRQNEIEKAEAEAVAVIAKSRKVAEVAASLIESQKATGEIQEARAEKIRQREAELADAVVAVKQLQALLKDQQAAEKMLDRVREGRSLPGVLRRLLGR